MKEFVLAQDDAKRQGPKHAKSRAAGISLLIPPATGARCCEGVRSTYVLGIAKRIWIKAPYMLEGWITFILQGTVQDDYASLLV